MDNFISNFQKLARSAQAAQGRQSEQPRQQASNSGNSGNGNQSIERMRQIVNNYDTRQKEFDDLMTRLDTDHRTTMHKLDLERGRLNEAYGNFVKRNGHSDDALAQYRQQMSDIDRRQDTANKRYNLNYNQLYAKMNGDTAKSDTSKNQKSISNEELVNVLKKLAGKVKGSKKSKDSTKSTKDKEVEEDDAIEYTYKDGDTFGQVLLDLGLSDSDSLWGDEGDVAYYTKQLNDAGVYGNVPVGSTIKLRRRK